MKKSNTALLKWTDKWTFLYIQSELVPAQAIVELLQNFATKRPNRLWQEFKILFQQKLPWATFYYHLTRNPFQDCEDKFPRTKLLILKDIFMSFVFLFFYCSCLISYSVSGFHVLGLLKPKTTINLVTIWSVFIHVVSIYANLLEQKERFHKKRVHLPRTMLSNNYVLAKIRHLVYCHPNTSFWLLDI